jgi:Tn3 transposase DDE domain-containing protein
MNLTEALCSPPRRIEPAFHLWAGRPWTTVPKLAKQPEPANLERLKAAMQGLYVDTHGASDVGFAFTRLLGFSLLPRLKNIGAARLCLPDPGLAESLPQLSTVLTRPIRWELIAEQYDQMVKFATALKLRPAEPEQILRRITRPGPPHRTYAALVELGRAAKSVFVALYLRSETLRRQIRAQRGRDPLYYQTVWQARRAGDMTLIKTLLYTGVRVANSSPSASTTSTRTPAVSASPTARAARAASCRSRRPSAKPSPCTSPTGARPAATTCSSRAGRSPTPPAASERCSPATQPQPGCRTTCRPTGCGSSCSPG